MGGFAEIDARLNVWALANGVELHREAGPPPARTLAWYADRAERRIVVRPAAGDSGGFDLHLGVGRGGTGDRGVVFRTGVEAGALSGVLEQAVETANALAPDHDPGDDD